MVDGRRVTMAGFWGMYGWQMPKKYSRDLVTSVSSLPHDWTHSETLVTNSE